jgi:hypothetical protein
VTAAIASRFKLETAIALCPLFVKPGMHAKAFGLNVARQQGECAVRLFGLLLICMSLAPFAHAGNDLSDALADSKTFGFAKLMVVADDKKGGRPNQATPGFGGKLGIETGAWHDFSFKAAWYTTSDLGMRRDNPRQTDAYMFDLDKKPYSLLGELQFNYAAGNTQLVTGRQEFFSPIINTYDYRIIPNLFEAVTLTNRDIPETTVTLAYVSKMSGLDGLVTYSEFRSMSQQTYTSLLVASDGTPDAINGDTLDPSSVVGEHGVWVTGIVHGKENKVQLWNFHGVDTLNTWYLDGRLNRALNRDVTARLEGQAYRVVEVGKFKDYLAQRGLNASYSLIGLKGTLAHQPSGISMSFAANRFTGNQRTVTAFGNWGGYPEFVSMPYMYAEQDGISAIAQSRLARMTLLFDLAAYGLKDQSLLLGHANIDIDDRILPNSDIKTNTLLYRAKISPQLSARIALEARSSPNARYDNEFVALALRYDF